MFCKTVWNGLHILPDGYIRLCSIGSNSKKELDMQRCRDKDGNVMHILTHDLHDIMNSDKHREVRLFNKTNPTEWSPHCDCCEHREHVTKQRRTHPNSSRRIQLMTHVDTADLVTEHNYSDKISSDGSVDWLPSSLDVRFGNLCNQKCIMCDPVFSNLWYDEFVDYYKKDTFGQGTVVKITKDLSTNKWIDPPQLHWFEDPRWWPKFDQMAGSLRHIYITGGEPMVTPAHDEMLDRLIANGHAKNIRLEYDSNCSAINDKIAQRWQHFRAVHIRASMDATGAEYELIRSGGRWEKFVENIKKLKQYERQFKNVKLMSITTCFQIATVYSIIESEKFCRSMGVNFHVRFLEGPAHHSTYNLPRAAKLKLIEYYSQRRAGSAKATLILEHLHNMLDHDIDAAAVGEFVRFMDYLDTTRKTDWRTVIPDVSNLLETVDNTPE
jgi:hypothetical protein